VPLRLDRQHRAVAKQAERRGLCFDLTPAEWGRLAAQPCYYCGKEKDGPLNGVGLDRIDSQYGYFDGNVVPCCGVCNWAKGTRSQDEFWDWVVTVIRHMRRTGRRGKLDPY
jgi:hypothetical protein